MNLSKQDAETRMGEFNPERPYNNLPPLPPKAEIESRPILSRPSICLPTATAVPAGF